MTFLNPAILAGLLAVGLPVLIHLLSKPQLRRIHWAAMRFLMAAVQKNRRRAQAEDILLLILRALLVALFVLLFARPALLTDAPLQLGGLAAPAVILLDNSMSMGQSNGTETRFDQAKGMADDLISKLEPGSTSAFFLVSDHVKAVIPKPTENLAILRRSIDRAPLTDGGSNLYLGIKMAMDLLKSLPGAHREIFVLTDGQQSGLRQLGKIHELQQTNKDIALHFIVVGDKGEDNLDVSNLQLAGTVASIDQTLRCVVTVNDWGQNPAQNVVVKLSSDGGPSEDEATIDQIEPNSSRSVTLVARFHDAGYHSLTASIPGDRLPADNHRSLALLVIAQVRTLVVEGTTNPDPVERDGFFLSHALVPVSPEEASRYYVKVATANPDDLESANIRQNQLIFLSNIAELTPHAAQNLHDYVAQGGGLVVFPGPSTDTQFYNGDPNFSALLPAKLGLAEDAPASEKFLGWQSKGYEHPLVTLWNKPESGNLGGVRSTRYFPLTMKGAAAPGTSDQEVVVKYTDGEPAVVEQSVGKGKVILFSSTATTAWTTLPIHPSFVALLSRIISYETSGLSGNLNIPVGQSFSTAIDSTFLGREVSVLRPGETKREIIGEVEAGDGGASLHDGETEKAGPYQLFVGGEAKPKSVFAVQADPDESDLARISKTDIDSLNNPKISRVDAHGNPVAPAEESHLRVPGRELWTPLAITALLLAVAEMALAHRFSQSK